MLLAVSFFVSIVVTVLHASGQVERVASLAVGVAMLMASFAVANILRSDFVRTGRSMKLQVSSPATFFFGPLYLQLVCGGFKVAGHMHAGRTGVEVALLHASTATISPMFLGRL